MSPLDNLNFIKTRDRENALKVVAEMPLQAKWDAEILRNSDALRNFSPKKIVVAGMGGSALSALIAQNWLDKTYQISQTFSVVCDYSLPNYVDQTTLAIIISVSGNTEETLSALADAEKKSAKIVVVASGGELEKIASAKNLPFIKLVKISQPRYGIVMHLRAIAKILENSKIALGSYQEIADLENNFTEIIKKTTPESPIDENPAKQLALHCAGKTPLIFASQLFSPVAYKWKISFNENAKNTAWNNEFPEFSHNEFVGWSSHPIEKPFAIIDLRSSFDHPQINKRFELTAKLLSGQRPAAWTINLRGETILEQMIFGALLADFTSIYLAILNGVDPTPVHLVEKLKKEL